MRVAVVGATGMVGRVMFKVLEERNFPITELIPVASSRSVNTKLQFKGQEVTVVSMADAIAMAPDVALFSAGGGISLEYAPQFAAVGTTVIDNSSAWRMHDDKQLVVPEVNADVLSAEDKIIANPNCSTIQMVVALGPLHKKYGIKRLVVSTYQSVTGTGKQAVAQMSAERSHLPGESINRVYPYQIDLNCLPSCGSVQEDGYTTEEIKLVKETRKILRDPSIAVTATAVRIPVIGGHSESVNITYQKDYDINEVRELLANAPGVKGVDNISEDQYPMPLQAHDKDDVFVGRIRRDHSLENSLNLWIVSDNLRKGAATNTVQIAEYLVEKGLLKAKETIA